MIMITFSDVRFIMLCSFRNLRLALSIKCNDNYHNMEKVYFKNSVCIFINCLVEKNSRCTHSIIENCSLNPHRLLKVFEGFLVLLFVWGPYEAKVLGF